MSAEELIEATIIDYGNLKKIQQDYQYFKQYYSLLAKRGEKVFISDFRIDMPSDIPYTLSMSSLRIGPVKLEGLNPYKLRGLSALVKSPRDGSPLHAIVEISNTIHVYLAYERVKSTIGIDFGLRHIVTLVALRDKNLWKVRYWDDPKIMELALKYIGSEQSIENLSQIRNRIEKLTKEIVAFIVSLYPKIVAIEDLKEYEEKPGKVLRIMQETLERELYKNGIKFKALSPMGTSKTCFRCGYKNGNVYSSLFTCPKCGLKADRDFNAALNLAYKCIYLC